MIDTGGTICKASDHPLRLGARADVVGRRDARPLLSDPATEAAEEQPDQARSSFTNTLAVPPEKQLDKITVLSIARRLIRKGDPRSVRRRVRDDLLFGGLS